MYSRNRKEAVINGKTVVVESRIEHSRARTSAHQYAMDYTRGKLPSMYRDTEEELLSVYYHNRLLGNIRKATNGMYVCGRFSHRDSDTVVEMLVKSVLQ